MIQTSLGQALREENLNTLGGHFGSFSEDVYGSKRYLAFNKDRGWYVTKEYNLFWRVVRYALGFFMASCSPFAETHLEHIHRNFHKWSFDLTKEQLDGINSRIKDVFRKRVTVVTTKVIEAPSGIQNGGNTCWLNATVQVLLSSKKVRDAIEQKKLDLEQAPTPKKKGRKKKAPVNRELEAKTAVARVLVELKAVYDSPASDGKESKMRDCVKKLRKLVWDLELDPSFDGSVTDQQDPSNIFTEILKVLDIGEHKFTTKMTSLSKSIPEENRVHERSDPNWMLDVCLSGVADDGELTLSALMHALRAPERVTKPSERLAFENAKGKNVKTAFEREVYLEPPLPDVLPIRFKRFKYEDGSPIRLSTKLGVDEEKDANEVDVWDLSFLVNGDEEANYRLKGVVVHHGGVDGGHYTSYVKQEDGTWFNCDDSTVTISDVSEINEGYLFLFEKVTNA